MDVEFTYNMSEEDYEDDKLIDYGGEPETAQHFCHQWRELALLGNTS
jgi:hypothetical protein